LILQTGIRINRSNPGAVVSRAKYVGLTYHKPQRHMVSVLHSFGREAYQLIGPDALLVGLDSTVDTLTWRQWVRPRQGIQLRLEKYRTPFYSRQGAELALFQEF
jgi:YaiO family outer membrane protein